MKIYISILLLAVTVLLHSAKIEGTRGTRTRIFTYENHLIKLWLDETETRVIQAALDGNVSRHIEYHVENNYLIRPMKEGNLAFVAHMKQDRSLLAVTPPYPQALGKEYCIEPTDTTWYIIFEGERLQLTVDHAENPIEIRITPANEPHQGIEPQLTEVAGIAFNVFRDHRGEVLAVSLPPRQHPGQHIP